MKSLRRIGGHGSERREDVRRHLPAAYTEVAVRRAGRQRYSLRGHVLDVSAGGMCFEVDSPLTDGEPIEVRVSIPGEAKVHVVEARGRVVRQANQGETGPAVMAMAFQARSKPRLRHELAL